MLAIGLVAICFDALFQSAVPAVFRTVLNDLQEDPAAFVAQGWQRAALEAVVVMCGFLVFAHIGHTFTLRGASRWANRLRVVVFDHVQHLSVDYFARHHVGDLASRINQDVERFEIALRQLMVITWTIVMIVLAILFIAWIDPVVAIVAFTLFAVGAAAVCAGAAEATTSES